MKGERVALFPGTFDPFTNGHLDLTRRAARLFDRVIVAVAVNPGKSVLFPVEERVAMIQAVVKSMRQVEVVHFSDLVVSIAERVGALVMIRGLRAVSDFEIQIPDGADEPAVVAQAGDRVPDARSEVHLPQFDARQGSGAPRRRDRRTGAPGGGAAAARVPARVATARSDRRKQ